MFGVLKSIFGAAKVEVETRTPPGFKRLPAPQDAQSYATVLAGILAAQSDHAKAQIQGALNHLPGKTEDLQFGIHPDQDAEGTFSVLIHLGGPDLYVLNKAIEEHRYLFDIRRVEGGLNVQVPLFDPDEVHYVVNDVIANAAADWIAGLWAEAGQSHPDLPVMVFCEDDYGTTPRWLQNAPA